MIFLSSESKGRRGMTRLKFPSVSFRRIDKGG